MQQAEPDILAGTGEARRRRDEAVEVRDHVYLWQPVAMAVVGSTLQQIVTAWHEQPTQHALTAPTNSTLFILQLRRFDFVGSSARKGAIINAGRNSLDVSGFRLGLRLSLCTRVNTLGQATVKAYPVLSSSFC